METVELSVCISDATHLKAMKAFAKALNIKLKVKKVYNKDFVNKIAKSEQEIVDGKTKKLQKNEFAEYLGL